MRGWGLAAVAVLWGNDAWAQCAATWDPGSYDGPIQRVITIGGEGGIGAVKNDGGPGPGRRAEESADPWYIGFEGALLQNLGSPSVKLLAEGRYGRAFSIGSQRLNTTLWGLRSAVLFGGHREEVRAWNNILSQSSEWTGSAANPNQLTTTYNYCPESSAFRTTSGVGVGAEVDRVAGGVGFTVNYAGVWQTYRSAQTVMFDMYGLYGPRMGLSGGKYGAGATVRVMTDGSLMGGTVEGWSSGEGGALLVTGFIGGGGAF